MAMPPQLERGLLAKRYSRRTEQRPLVEQLPRLDIDDLCRWNVFPTQHEWHKAHYLEAPFRYPFLKSLVISLDAIEANHHTGYNQIIPLHWIKTGFGGNNRPRPMLSCTNCGRAVRRLYRKHGSLKCRRCTDATYASRICSGKQTRASLQAIRLANFFNTLPPKTRHSTKARLIARHHALPKHLTTLNSTRLDHKAMRVQSNYGIRATPYWR